MDYTGKSLFFMGDSITANGSFIHLLRLHLKSTGKKIFVHNKGIPGGTVPMGCAVLEEEIDGFVPNCVVISYGANDIGYWKYSTDTLDTSELYDFMKEKSADYMYNLNILVNRLKKLGITPILCSPFCMSKKPFTKAEIETIVDLKEKEEIDYKFYNKEVFDTLNKTLKSLGEKIQAYAKENIIEFWDLFTDTYNEVDETCFSSDGIHYQPKGDEIIAKALLKYITGESYTTQAPSNELEKIAHRELEERSYYFVKYNILCWHKGVSDKELIEKLDAWLEVNGNKYGLTKERARGFANYIENHHEKQIDLIEKIINI